MAKDITNDIPINVGNPTTTALWTNSAEDYDVAIGGQPFFLAPNDNYPYRRQTAPFRKDQFDSSKEPGEQSLVGWWLRSQSSFHLGSGIKFYDPSSGETVPYRFFDSEGVDVWTRGQATLLRNTTPNHFSTSPLRANGRSYQTLRTISYTVGSVTTDAVLFHDGFDVDKIDSSGTLTHFIDYNSGVDDKVYAICDDGVYAYWVTNDLTGAGKLRVYKKLLSDDYSVAATSMFTSPSIVLTNAVMEYTKERIIMCANNAVYEFNGSATTMPTAVYTHPNSAYVYSSITSSGPAIYVAGYNGSQSTIQKFTLITTSGSLPTLSSAITAAELPPGEVVHKIYYYLGYMLIGTSKGVRVATVSDQDGSLSYGPLFVTTSQPCFDFAARDRFVWCAIGANGKHGLVRVDLGSETESLRFAYANDISYESTNGYATTACALIGNTGRLAFSSHSSPELVITNKVLTSNVATLTTGAVAHGYVVGDNVFVGGVDATFNGYYTVTAVTTTTFSYAKTAANVASVAVSASTAIVTKVGGVYLEDASTLRTSGYITTGAIRFTTLEPKHYKFIRARGSFTSGSLDVQTIDEDGTSYNVITHSSAIPSLEVTTSSPDSSREFLSYKFTLARDTTITTNGPTFKGYQVKALPGVKRQRLIQVPLWCFDVESDRFNVKSGYSGRAWERIQLLEDIEANGDIINFQDFTTGERVQSIIEEVQFYRTSAPDKRFDGFGGRLIVTVRTVL